MRSLRALAAEILEFDSAQVLMQLGVIPPPGQPPALVIRSTFATVMSIAAPNSLRRLPIVRAPYDAIAREYYTDARKTSRNFDACTVAALDGMDTTIPPGYVLDVGAGRGRIVEFLKVDPSRVVQLDSSARMFEVEPREPAVLRILHEAERLPFPDGEFACVGAFLCDPFLGLEFLAEAWRVLRPGGLLVGTTPSLTWGGPLRDDLGLDLMTTRFVLTGGVVQLAPSNLYSVEQFSEMLAVAGFPTITTDVAERTLPESVGAVSADILRSAQLQGVEPGELPVLMSFAARR